MVYTFFKTIWNHHDVLLADCMSERVRFRVCGQEDAPFPPLAKGKNRGLVMSVPE